MKLQIRKRPTNLNWPLLSILFVTLFIECSPSKLKQDFNEEGAFLVYRRQSLIGKETYSISTNNNSIIVNSLQGENERGRITGVQAVLHLDRDLNPSYYVNRRIANEDTTNILRVEVVKDSVSVWEKRFDVVTTARSSNFFPLHSNIPAAMEMMLYHYYFRKGETTIPTLPRGEISITKTGQDEVEVNGKKELLDRYVVEGINWGGRTIWLDQSKNLVALVKANTQIRELIKKGYEEALPTFIAGNVMEQMNALSKYTQDLKQEQAEITALVGGDIVDGLSDDTKKGMTLLIENGRIKTIGKSSEVVIPSDATVIDVSGKTLMPGLWDMHAHSNQVQWAPAYLAGGITTIRDNGNEIEFATAFRDAIAKEGAIGPDILLAGMTDGAGIRGNGIIRATTPQEAREVVAMYHEKGYKQIKIYTSVESEVVTALAEEAHKRGITATGHVPTAVGNAVEAVERGMDHLSHSGLFMSVLIPDKSIAELGRDFLNKTSISKAQVARATDFFLEHKTVLDPTIALNIVRGLPRGTPVETVEPDVGKIAYELWEGKRFRAGLRPGRAELAKAGYSRTMKIIGEFFRAGVPIVAGTDNVVPVYSLYLEIESYQKLAGLTPREAIKTATIIPAKAMGLDKETGTLEIGKEADIAILNKNPLDNIENLRTVSAVVTNGNYYESDPLWVAADFKPRKEFE